ncbi:beta domain containing protein [Corchorus olitorius]|uniref:Beta domain containing protein n=1 Tax=Corchorus olitorius TaxID=93759 RepID=A0A1R3FUE0_9ROSI|nr:beta domain containing protein [Corchorus olitorius]
MPYCEAPVTQTVPTKATQPIISHSTNAVGNTFTPGPVASSVDNIATPNNESASHPFLSTIIGAFIVLSAAMPPKPKTTTNDDIINHLTTTFSSQFQDLNSSIAEITSALSVQTATITDLQHKIAKIEKAPHFLLPSPSLASHPTSDPPTDLPSLSSCTNAWL